MIINAAEKFAQRNTNNWYQKLSSKHEHMSGKVVSFQSRLKSANRTDIIPEPDALTPDDITHLQNSASLLVIHCEEITTHFYQNILKTMWWDNSRFENIIESEKERLLTSLLAVAEKPTETSQIAFFLADNWIKYRYMSDIGQSYDTITYYLNNAIDDVLGEYFTPETCVAWRKTLAPNHVFHRTLDARTSKKNKHSAFDKNHK